MKADPDLNSPEYKLSDSSLRAPVCRVFSVEAIYGGLSANRIPVNFQSNQVARQDCREGLDVLVLLGYQLVRPDCSVL